MGVSGERCFVFVVVLCSVFAGFCIADCPPADLSGNCIVGIEDLVILADQWLAPVGCAGHIDDCADIIGSDGVNIGDFAQLAANWLVQGDSAVVINEIHYDYDNKVDQQEYVELYNNGIYDVDISGWYFSDGISYTFPQGTNLPAGGYILVAENPARVDARYSAAIPGLLYGPFSGSLKNEGERIAIANSSGQEVDEVDYKLGFPWPTVGDAVPIGGSVGTGHSIQLVNPATDNNLAGSWRSGPPSPTIENLYEDSSVIFAGNIPPQIRQVKHYPQLPKADQVVTITAKVTDPDGVGVVKLRYQLIDPGSYIRISDSQYDTTWTKMIMLDDGLNGDAVAGDNIYTVQMPVENQTHRQLVRYRISVKDTLDKKVIVPYQDDPQPNFAYFVYDGVPSWRGADRPGVTPDVTFSTDVMRSLPVYHLIANSMDITNCQYNRSYEESRFYGTMIYEGNVYDHIKYQIRGEFSTYVSGKNKWKFFFQRGHEFQARDNYGNKNATKFKTINFSAGATPWVPVNRGMAIDESLAFALYNMADIPSPKTNFFQFRVIDEIDESTSNQYAGDLWGLYSTIENPDGRFLNEHDLPDGNTYKIENNVGDKKNQGPTQPVDSSDWNTFKSGIASTNTVAWWQSNLNLERYYSFRAINRAVNNMDLRNGWNAYFYHNPDTDLWTIIPWDLDMLWLPVTHWSGVFNLQNSLNHSEFSIGYKNRGRELQDLLLTSEQIGQLVDELAEMVNPEEQEYTMADVDRFMWNYHPNSSSSHTGQFNNPSYRHTDFSNQYINRTLESGDHEGSMGWVKFFLTPVTDPLPWSGYSLLNGVNGYDFLESEVADSAIPDTPVISYTGSVNWPVNDLQFQTSAFSDPQGSGTFEALKWRIAEVDANTSQQGTTAVLVQEESEWKYFKGTEEASSPAGAWRELIFDDSAWLDGQTSIGYGDTDDNTILNDMRNTYSTIYLRKKFSLTDPADISSLSLDVYVDDGCIIWVNGTEITRCNVGDGEKTFGGVTFDDGEAAIDNAAWETIVLDEPYDYLIAGENIIAIHVLNHRINSSDLSIDIKLTADLVDNGGVSEDTTFVRRGKYEIDAKWESYEIAEYQNSISIPASEVKVGRTYRVRCRMKDDSGRWSHWSDAIEFVAGVPISNPVLDDLRITEIMYNPAPAPEESGFNSDDFEFIELKNVGTVSFDLSGLSFVDGVRFEFPVEAGHWKFDETSGLTATDSFGSNDGQLLGGPVWRGGSGQIGGSLEFDGIDDTVVISHYYGPTGKRARTCSAWIKTPTVKKMAIMSWGTADGNGGLWRMIVSNDGQLSLLVGGESSRITGSTFIADDQWHHVAITLTDIDGDDEITVSDVRLYVDGQEEIYSIRGVDAIDTGNSMEVHIGSLNNNIFFDGMIDDVRIYNCSLTQSQIAADMESASISLSKTTSLASGEMAIVVSNAEAFESAYPAAASFVVGEYLGNLSNGGEGVKLEDYMRGTVVDFDYSDDWYPITDGEGFSLTIIDELGDKTLLSEKISWRPSSTGSGTPGTDDSGSYFADGAIVINEVLAHSHAEAPDWIELYNTTGDDINIGGWFLSDNDNDFKKYQIPDGTVITEGSYVVFYEDQHFGTAFALSENGETVYLSSGLNGELTGYSEQEDFGASETGVSFGRYYKVSTDSYNFVPMSVTTANAPNAAPDVGPIVISEIMYNPAAGGDWDHDDYEYIELYNISGADVTLETYDPIAGETNAWKFSDGVDYTFPLGTTIAAGERIVIARNLTAFGERHTTLPEELQVFGPFADNTKLSNGGERLQLAKPGDTDAAGTRHYIRVDRVNYSDGSHPVGTDPWPTSADGGGSALERISLSEYGNDVANWQTAAATPGT